MVANQVGAGQLDAMPVGFSINIRPLMESTISLARVLLDKLVDLLQILIRPA